MADQKNKAGQEVQQQLKEKVYDKAIKMLAKEREQLKNELDKDYREARRYVRSHPEEGVLMGFVGGIAVGFILGKILK